MRKILIPFFILFGIVCFFAARILYVHIKTSQEIFQPKKVGITLTPPKNAVEGQITSLSGNVKKEGRNDTDFKDITKPISLVEGEEIATGANGTTILSFPQIATLTVERNTELDYLNGLPKELIVRQPQGTITYTASDAIQPFFVRSLGLLIQIKMTTNVNVTTDTENQTVSVNVIKGNVTLAYSDAKNNTQVKKLSSHQAALFDYNSQILTVE